MISRVSKQDGIAVGGSDGDGEIGLGGDHSVSFALETGGIGGQNPVGMDLLEGIKVRFSVPSAKSMVQPR
jgi:hypothetical protein